MLLFMTLVVVVMMMMMMLVVKSNALIFLVKYKIHNALKMIAQKQQTGHKISKWLFGSGNYHFIMCSDSVASLWALDAVWDHCYSLYCLVCAAFLSVTASSVASY